MTAGSPPNELPEFILTRYASAAAVPQDVLQGCLDLVAKIKDMYEDSGMGWNTRRKKSEFDISGMEFLIITRTHGAKANGDTSEFNFSGDGDGDGAYGQAAVCGEIAAFASVLPQTLEFERDSDDNDDDDDADWSSILGDENGVNDALSGTLSKAGIEESSSSRAFFSDGGGDLFDPTAAREAAAGASAARAEARAAAQVTEPNLQEQEKPKAQNTKRKQNEIKEPVAAPTASDSYVTYLYELHVASAFKNKGLAKHLLDAVKAVCVDQPCTLDASDGHANHYGHSSTSSHSNKLMLTVFNMNIAAQNFYLWNGFEYYTDDDDVDLDEQYVGIPRRRLTRSQKQQKEQEQQQEKKKNAGHKLHARLKYKQQHNRGAIIKGWQEMIWRQSDESRASRVGN